MLTVLDILIDWFEEHAFVPQLVSSASILDFIRVTPQRFTFPTNYETMISQINLCSEPFHLKLSDMLRFSWTFSQRNFSHFASWCCTQGRWLYSLLACLEKPLLPEAHSSIRQLARRCAQLRSTLASRSAPAVFSQCYLLPHQLMHHTFGA